MVEVQYNGQGVWIEVFEEWLKSIWIEVGLFDVVEEWLKSSVFGPWAPFLTYIHMAGFTCMVSLYIGIRAFPPTNTRSGRRLKGLSMALLHSCCSFMSARSLQAIHFTSIEIVRTQFYSVEH